MTVTGKFRKVRHALTVDPAFSADVAREKALMAELDLGAARAESGLTQAAVAREMGRSQENVSRIERERDIRVSTLADFVRAQGGELEITAIFNGKRVSLMRPPRPHTRSQDGISRR